MSNLWANRMMGRASATDFHRSLLGVSDDCEALLWYRNLRLAQMSATMWPGIGKQSLSVDESALPDDRNQLENTGDPRAKRLLCTGTCCPSTTSLRCASARSTDCSGSPEQ